MYHVQGLKFRGIRDFQIHLRGSWPGALWESRLAGFSLRSPELNLS